MKKDFIGDNELLIDRFDNSVEAAEGDLKFRTPKRIFKKRQMYITIGVVALVAIISISVLVAALLMRNEESYDDSAAFYFASDKLSEDGGEFADYGTIKFKIRNYADSLRVSHEAVDNFVVFVSADGKDVTSDMEIVIENTTLEPDVRCECNVEITVPDEYIGKPLDVTVISEPIKKELKGTFTLRPEWGYEINDKEGNACAELVIYADAGVELELEWDPEAVIADSTDSFVRTAIEGESRCIVNLAGGTGVTIHMFKKDINQVYTKDSEIIKLAKAGELVSDTAEGAETAEAEPADVTEEAE